LRRHQRRHAGDPGIALLTGEAEYQRFGPGAVDERALLFLDRQLALLGLIDRQSRAGLQI
jgi:hypothetical protein